MRVKNVLWNAALVFFCDCDDAHVFTFSFGNDYPYPRYGTIFFFGFHLNESTGYAR